MYISDLGREINILLICFYLIAYTKKPFLKLIFIIGLLGHLYKLINNYDTIYEYTMKHKELFFIFFILLFRTFYKLIYYNKGFNTWLFYFSIGIIIPILLYGKKQLLPVYKTIKYELLGIFFSLLLFIHYTNFKYKNLFLVEAINHLLLLLI